MGSAKNAQMEREERIQKAIRLCIGFSAINECPIHEGTYIDSMEYSDPDELTALILEEDPDSLEYFGNHDEMVECIRNAIAFAGEECGSCAKNRNS